MNEPKRFVKGRIQNMNTCKRTRGVFVMLVSRKDETLLSAKVGWKLPCTIQEALLW